jgi:phosphoribosylformylglycinamidine cyclo-ligase
MSVSYRDAGVDLGRAEQITARITQRLGSGLFGGFVPASRLKAYDAPLLVSSIDGIGTKVRLAAQLGHVDGLGQDIVHHCVNDIAVHGAEPLFFLDYLAFHRLDPLLVERIVGSIAAACDALDIALAGGETAEMPLVYPPGHFDIAGAVVGVVEEAGVVDGHAIQAGDVLLGLPSSGLHTNGYSLVQHLFGADDYQGYVDQLGSSLGDALLTPHRSYLPAIRELLATGAVHGLAHITGGGIAGNLGRIIPAHLRAVVDVPPPPPLFPWLAARGIGGEEMLAVFNMGIGLIAVCDPAILDRPAWPVIGSIESAADHQRRVIVHGNF